MANRTPTATVEAFIAEWSQGMASIQKACDTWLSDDVAYENVGLPRTVTRAAAKDVLATFLPGLDVIEVEMRGIAAAGNTVFTERVDHSLHAEGSIIAALRLMGVYVVEGRRIRQRREYFHFPSSNGT